MNQKRMVDKNSVRGGAGISAVVLLIAFVFQAWIAVAVIGVALGMGSLLGVRTSPLGATYRAAKKWFRLSIGVELEEEPPPRFAQTLGFVFLALATLIFLIADGGNPVAWTFTLIVAGLQGLLAVTGLCVGCEIYTYTSRFRHRGAHAA